MIEVSYLEREKNVEALEIKGHANYADEGQDIVCSAVSAIGVGGLNALENIDDIDIICEKGYISVKGKGLNSDHNQIVIRTIVIQLYTIEKSYKKFIKISKS